MAAQQLSSNEETAIKYIFWMYSPIIIIAGPMS
jgi:hypothetical protein